MPLPPAAPLCFYAFFFFFPAAATPTLSPLRACYCRAYDIDTARVLFALRRLPTCHILTARVTIFCLIADASEDYYYAAPPACFTLMLTLYGA